ncbi:hypothetical protein HY639_01845 [Candidatus Woesearchaeota archaeon]|nr:hypothetical protein [Candidatus Woesearchaeota archaeon]
MTQRMAPSGLMTFLLNDIIIATQHFGDPENPSLDEITAWVAAVMNHSSRVEYYLHALNVQVDDGQRPHDLVGPGNKLEWAVIQGLAPKDKSSPERQRRLRTALELHRQGQHHHHMWNAHNVRATESDLKYGAIDAICSLREPRDYQGGMHTWDEVTGIIGKNPEHKKQWLWWAMDAIRGLEGAGRGYRTEQENHSGGTK